MKRHVLIALAVLTVTPGVASSQMMGAGMGEGKTPPPAQKSAKAQVPASGMSGGMMGQGMMSGMMGQCKEMMGGGMMGAEMTGAMMPSMMDAMMPGKTRGCMMMAEGMMKGQMDMARMRKTLALSEEQSEKLKSGMRPFQKEAILTLASLKVAELELGDILAGAKVDFGQVEAKLKEIEGMRTKIRLAHLKAAEAVKGVLGKEQLEKLQEAAEISSAPAPATPASPQTGITPPSGEEHEQHH